MMKWLSKAAGNASAGCLIATATKIPVTAWLVAVIILFYWLRDSFWYEAVDLRDFLEN
jgi:hypothetical protein